MKEIIKEQDAYEAYVKACHSEADVFISEFNFLEWRAMGRPKSHKVSDGYYGESVEEKE